MAWTRTEERPVAHGVAAGTTSATTPALAPGNAPNSSSGYDVGNSRGGQYESVQVRRTVMAARARIPTANPPRMANSRPMPPRVSP